MYNKVKDLIWKPRIVLAAMLPVFVAVIAAQLLYPAPSQAQSSGDLQISITPPVTYLRLKPGAVTAHTITITNAGKADVRLSPSVVEFKSDGSSGQPILGGPSRFTYFKDAAAAFKPLVVPAGKSAQLTLAIEIPPTASQEEFPMTILFRAEPVASLTGGSQAIGVVGSNLIVAVTKTGLPPLSLSITDIKMLNLADSFRSIEFTPIISNSGTGAQQASGKVEITDWRGQIVAEYELYPDMVLAGSQRSARALARQANHEENGAETVPEPKLFSFKQGFLIGPYKITTTVKQFTPPEATQEVDDASASYTEVVFAFPFAAVLLICAASLALLLFKVASTKMSNVRI